MRMKAVFVAISFLATSLPALAADEVEEVTVIGVTPLSGAKLPEEWVPYPVQTIGTEDIDEAQAVDFADYAQRRIPGVIINDAQNNRRQPDLIYRGFTASPLLGLPQGMSMYVNGVRFNEPFGDTVNWDLVSGASVRSMSLAGSSNPVYGLNTLGGAIVVDTHTGFSSPGTRASMEIGSFSTHEMQVSTGGNNGEVGYFLGTEYFSENGWRDASGSEVRNLYANIGHENERTSINLNLNLADNELTGNGASPEDLLRMQGRERIFTSPDRTSNDFRMLDLQLSHAMNDNLEFGGSFFYRNNDVDTFNGDGSEFESCAEYAEELVQDGDVTITGLTNPSGFSPTDAQFDTAAGMQMSEAGEHLCETEGLDDSTYANVNAFLTDVIDERVEDQNGDFVEEEENNVERNAINNTSARLQDSYGGTMQAIYSADLFGRGNQLVAGVDYYRGEVEFTSEVEIASLNPDRSTAATGLYVPEEGVALNVETKTISGFLTDTIAINDSTFFTLSGRYNRTEIDLRDRGGTRGRTGAQPDLTGSHTFTRFNPAAGISYVTGNEMKLFANYSESSRAPSPVELACAREDAPCSLPNAFLADPPLEQVVTRGVDLGASGENQGIGWQVSLYASQNEDDIVFQTTGGVTSNEGFFRNVGDTRRLGMDLAATGRVNEYFGWNLGYSYLKATYEDSFLISSPNHPQADNTNTGTDGQFRVDKGDSLPGIPEHSLKAQLTYYPRDKSALTLEMIYSGSRHFRGDEANLDREIGSFAIFNLLARHDLSDSIYLTARVENLFDKDYNTFGLYGEPDEVGIPGLTDDNTRFIGPGAPRAYYAGLNLRF